MFTAYVVVTLLAIAANAFSGVAALVRFEPILPGMAKTGVPESWLTILGTLKTAGAVGLLLGLVLFFCRCHHHPPACATTRRSSAWRSGSYY